MSAFEVEGLSVDDHEISFRVEGPDAASIGPKLMQKLQGLSNQQLEEFVE